MRFLPYEHYRSLSSLAPEYITEKLSSVIECRKLGFLEWWIYTGKPYIGTSGYNHFTMMRHIRYNNSFLPIVKVQIERRINGTTIDIKMRMHYFVIVFMSVWLFFTGLGAIIFTVHGFMTGNAKAFWGVAIFIAGYALVMAGFKFESTKTKKYLRDLLILEQEIDVYPWPLGR